MDTSETYIKMCEKAEEIQKLAHIPNIDDGVYVCKVHRIVMDYYESGYSYCPATECFDKPFIWLPRQDQLQEMVIEKVTDTKPIWVVLDNLFYSIYGEWMEKVDHSYIKQFSSMEQLWLAFVMKEKYNKVWSGGEWVSINEKQN